MTMTQESRCIPTKQTIRYNAYLVRVDFARLPLGPALADQLDLQEREGLDHFHAFRGRAHGSALVGAVQLATAG